MAEEPIQKWGSPILEPPEGDDDESRRNKFVEPYFQDAKPNQVVAILKAREPARILVAIGDKDNASPHLEYKQRWVNQFNFYLTMTFSDGTARAFCFGLDIGIFSLVACCYKEVSLSREICELPAGLFV